MSFIDTINQLLSGHKTDTKLKGKAARVDRGFRKINAFLARGMKLNPAPKREARHDKKPKQSQRGRWFFRCGDAGYRPGSKGSNVPVPYRRQ